MISPEGSDARAMARRQLLVMTRRALKDTSADQWLEVLATHFPQLVRCVSERDLEAIVALSMRGF